MEIFYLGLLMSAGFAIASAAERVGIPRVASYVLTGLLLAEPVFGRWIPGAGGEWTGPITNVTLGVIAFLIGAEIDSARVQALARTIAGVVLGQTAGILAAVIGLLTLASALFPALFADGPGLPAAVMLAVIGVATAPAGTLAIIEDYHARGDLTATLLAVVAIDDALTIVFFTLALGLVSGAGEALPLMDALRDIALSLAAGLAMGAVLGWLGRFVHRSDLRLPMILAAIFLNLGLAEMLGYPDLLSNIAMGYAAMRIFGEPEKVWIEPMTHVRDTIFLLFFTLAGTFFDPSVFTAALPLILLYCAARFIGKWSGAWLGAALAGAPSDIRNWAGLAMMPQAGVAIGLALHVRAQPGMQSAADLVLNVIIGSTVIFALLSPSLTKYALERAGEIDRAEVRAGLAARRAGRKRARG